MARDFAQIQHAFWTGCTGKALRGDATAQALALYLMTCRHSNAIGLYYLPVLYAAHETGHSADVLRDAMRRLEDVGFAMYDDATEFVWVVSMARFQYPKPLQATDRNVQGAHASLKEAIGTKFYAWFWDRYRDYLRLSSGDLPEPKNEAPSKPLRSPFEAPSGHRASPFEAPSKPPPDIAQAPSKGPPLEKEKEKESFTHSARAREGSGDPAPVPTPDPVRPDQDPLPTFWTGDPRDIPADAIDPVIPGDFRPSISTVARQLSQTEARNTLSELHGVYVGAVGRMFPGRSPAAESACLPGLARVLAYAARVSRTIGTGETPFQVAERMVLASVRSAGEAGQHVAKTHTLWGNESRGDVDGRLGELEARFRPSAVPIEHPPAPSEALKPPQRQSDGVVPMVTAGGKSGVGRQTPTGWVGTFDGEDVPVDIVRRRPTGVCEVRRRDADALSHAR